MDRRGEALTRRLTGPDVSTAERVGRIVADVYVPPAACWNDDRLWVAFFGEDHRLRVASRPRRTLAWETVTIDVAIGWDSHNHPSLAVDPDGCVHLVANMHAEPLVYLRTVSVSRPLDFVRAPAMVDLDAEQQMTYPRFLSTESAPLSFFFRSGVSGNGSVEMYRYSADTKAWTRGLDGLLVDGEGRRSPYLDTSGPIPGPDGSYHLVWVWRDAPEAESTHTISYARSADLVSWGTSDGSPLSLPLREGNAEIAVAAPPKAGLINNNVRLGFDASDRPVIAYHVRDPRGRLQIHCARREKAGWISRQLTDWDVEWDFSGRGSLDFEVQVGAPTVVGAEVVVEVRIGTERRLVRAGPDLEPTGVSASPIGWSPLESTPTDSGLRCFVSDLEASAERDGRTILVWEASPPRRDAAPETETTTATDLYLVTLRRTTPGEA